MCRVNLPTSALLFFLCKLGERRVCLALRMCNGHSVVYIRGSANSRSCPRYFLLGLKSNVILVLYFQEMKGLAFSFVFLFSFTDQLCGLLVVYPRFLVVSLWWMWTLFTRSFSFSIGLQLEILVFLQFFDHTDERKDVWRVCLACFPPESMASWCQELHSCI